MPAINLLSIESDEAVALIVRDMMSTCERAHATTPYLSMILQLGLDDVEVGANAVTRDAPTLQQNQHPLV